jgi:hypothetical protein
MPAADVQPEEQNQPAEVTSAIPRWTPEFDVKSFNLQAVLREASAQKKSVGELLKSLDYPVAELTATDLTESKDAGTIPASASSTASDLAGDDFEVSALEQMRDAARGTTVFLNHEYNVPEDVYGSVAAVELATRRAFNPLTERQEDMTFLDMDIAPVGADENPRAVQTTNMRKAGIRLGVSVTVLVLAYREREGGGRTITRVYYLECSIVGIPCNQTAWLRDDAKSFTPATPKSLPTMTGTQNKSAAITGATGAPSSTAAEGEKPSAPVPDWKTALATAKAMFADVLEENQNNIWLFMDSFYTVYRSLIREARGKSGDALNGVAANANDSVDEFAAELKQLLADEINEASTQETSDIPYYAYYSVVGRLHGLVQKSGARNSKADQALLNKAHDCIVEAGGVCSHKSAETADESEGGPAADESKQASFGEGQAKVAELEAKIASLTEELAAAVEMAEALGDELKESRETSEMAVEALEAIGREPV